MKPILIAVILLLACAGCGSEMATFGGGAAAGGAVSHTLTGAKEDLTIREAELIELYNRGVADGMKAEELSVIKQEIYDTRLGKQGVETAETLFGIDWDDPKAVGGGIGLISTLAYALLNRKKLSQAVKKYTAHKKGAAKFMREHSAEAKELYEDIGAERAKLKI